MTQFKRGRIVGHFLLINAFGLSLNNLLTFFCDFFAAQTKGVEKKELLRVRRKRL